MLAPKAVIVNVGYPLLDLIVSLQREEAGDRLQGKGKYLHSAVSSP